MPSAEGRGPVWAVVLAGGGSRRFGTDKLVHPVDDVRLVDRATRGLPPDVELVVVGPPELAPAGARTVREAPPGGGPAAAIMAGLRVALDGGADVVLVLPGDAPDAGAAAAVLLDRLLADPAADAVVATDAGGREQPLQLALRAEAARALVALGGPTGAANLAVRPLLAALDPPPQGVVLTAAQRHDIDTPEELTAWRLRDSPAVERVLALVAARTVPGRPTVLALDGPSGAGKSTLAAALALRTDAVVLPGDAFYGLVLPTTTAAEHDRLSDAELVEVVFDWARLRAEGLEPLAAGRAATYRPYDWTGGADPGGDGLLAAPVRRAPAPLVVLEGVYAGRPQLADLVDVSVLLEIDPAVRERRLDRRGDPDALRLTWERAERHYFDRARPAYDLVLEPAPAVSPAG